MSVVRVAIVGDFDRRKHSHWATEAALFHAAARVGVSVEPRWISTPVVAQSGAERALAHFHAIWGAPGSPYAAMDGILGAIEYARRSDISYLGTCAGCQYALIEFSRNVLGIRDADTAENASGSENIVITPVWCSMTGVTSSSEPRLAGPGVARPVAGCLLEQLCGSGELAEEYFCNFEINATFLAKWREAGLQIAARGAGDEVRAVELSGRRFFIATLFQPQLSSSFERPHPLIEGFLRAAAATRPSS